MQLLVEQTHSNNLESTPMPSATPHYASRFAANPSPLPLHPPGLVVRRVTSLDEKLATDLLVRRMYSWRGYLAEPAQHSLHDPNRFTIAAWQGDELAATLTLSCDDSNEMLCESLYKNEIAVLRRRNLRICEYSRLATDPEYSPPELLEKIIRTAYSISRSYFAASDAVVEVNPRHCRYYERQWGFTRIGPLRVCPRVDAPAVLLHRSLQHPLPESRLVAMAA